MTSAAKLFRTTVGISFVVVGVLTAVSAGLVAYRFVELLPLAVALLASSFAALGVALLTRSPYAVEWTGDQHLALRFAFRTEFVAPSDVIWYWKDGVRWSLFSTSSTTTDEIDAGVFVLLRYRRRGYGIPTVFCWLKARGPAFAKSGREFRTLLDEHLPDKQKRPTVAKRS